MSTTETISEPHPILIGARSYGLGDLHEDEPAFVDEATARHEIALACRALYSEGCMKGVGGHVSIRAGSEDTYWVNPHDLEFSEVTPADVVKVGFDGELLAGSTYPSAGVFFHPHVYANRPDVHAIVHTHSPWVTRLAALRRPLRMIHVQSVYFDGDLNVSTDPLEGIAEGLGSASHAVIPYHGGLTVGSNLGNALALHVTLEEAAHLDLTLPDDVDEMSPEDVERVKQVMIGSDYIHKTWELLKRKAEVDLSQPVPTAAFR